MLLITGPSGFVGQNLIASLGDYEWTGLSTRPETLPNEKGLGYDDFWKYNTESFTHYIHLAGKAHDLKKTADDQVYFEVNFALTKKLFDRFLADPQAKSFIFISSVKACADRVEGWLTEEADCKPVTAYGQSKRKAEEYLLANLPEDKKVYILRPCMIHGPGNKGNLNLLYGFAKKGLPFPLAAFDNQRSFLSVDNLCFVIKRLMENQIPPGIYHIADDETFSTNQLIQLMAQSLGKKPHLWKIPTKLIIAAAKVGDRLHLPLNSERLQKLTESYLASNKKIKLALGEEFPVAAEEGLMRTFDSFR
ncbi:MAG TPA: NAD-dependent epimerase/dehydratase family protein [Lunatimonas sp.]|nr:NAD-dependent epimerase/dehydratase family protein [Lunatimonas sp.]